MLTTLFLVFLCILLIYSATLVTYDLENAPTSLMMKEEVEERVITMEEDGRLGNLLMEMATLLLIGRHANVTVSLLPQVAHIWLSQFFNTKVFCQNIYTAARIHNINFEFTQSGCNLDSLKATLSNSLCQLGPFKSL